MGELNPDAIDGPVPSTSSARGHIAPQCRICRSKAREDVDRALKAGRGQREIAKQFRFSASSVQRHRAHVDADAIDSKAEAAHAAALLDEFLALPLDEPSNVLRRGKKLLDAQVRVALSLMPDNPRAASTIIARAQAALVDLHARAYKVIGTDAQPPAMIDNSVRILAVLDRMTPDALRNLAGGETLAITGDRQAT